LQDTLSDCGYKGALLVSLHARKASGEDVGDSVLGSTGIRGSLSTLLHFHHYRKDKIYTVQSDQTVRDDAYGELDETIVNRETATGVISLGSKYEDVKVQDKKDEWTIRRSKILNFVKATPGKTADDIAAALSMSKKTVLPVLEELEKSKDIRSAGAGVKGDPRLYFGDVLLRKEPPESATGPLAGTSDPVPVKSRDEVQLQDSRQRLAKLRKYAVAYPEASHGTEISQLEQAIAKLEGTSCTN